MREFVLVSEPKNSSGLPHEKHPRIWMLAFGAVLISGTTLDAQQTFHKWVDERGVVHFSNTTIPENAKQPESRIINAERHTSGSPFHASDSSIPLISLNNDSQKFVAALLEGPDSSQEVLMLVDTGAQTTLIDEDLAANLGLEHVRKTAIFGVGGSIPAWIGRLDRLKVGEEELRDIPVVVGPMPGLRLLGMDVLGRLSLSVRPNSLERE